ncbi:thiolase family protein [Selenomonas sp. TAMA-11512]|uniref:thiolase family protein n=1 Tax=Selenomonas sp. TAMA-11512 TaxID=3095337 RepID=UPI0030D544E3
MRGVYILGGGRTPILRRMGLYKHTPPEKLAAELIQKLLTRYNIEVSDVNGVFAGNAVGTGGNIARLMALTAGLPAEISAVTLDAQCASGLAAVDYAAARLWAGQGEVYIAGGMESSSLQPVRRYAKGDARAACCPQGEYMTAQFSPDELAEDAMLKGAERVAAKEHVMRAELDAIALESHQKACRAINEGWLSPLVYEIQGAKADDGPHHGLTKKLLARMPLFYGENSATTAGNSCRMNDGAAFVILCSERYLKRTGMAPMARVSATELYGGDAAYSPYGAMQAADRLLRQHHLSYEELAAVEFNEAFAVINALFLRAHPELKERYNRLGGALAYGHPYGASGAVYLLHLLRSMQLFGGGKGIFSIAGAGGMGTAILVESS